MMFRHHSAHGFLCIAGKVSRAEGGDVFDKLSKRTTYTEKDACDLCLYLLTYCESVSVDAKQLIASLLTVNPDHCITAADALESTWMKVNKQSLSGRGLVFQLVGNAQV